jgi:RNA polymerase sigma-70 factor, ECF subfamily
MNYASLPPDELIRICTETAQAAAWEEFIRRFNPLIARVVVRTARRWQEVSPHVLDDLVQETYLKLCAKNCRLLRTFESRQPESIYGYLKVVTANVVHDHFKEVHAAKRGLGATPEDIDDVEIKAASTLAPSLSNQGSIERGLLLQEIDQQLARSVPITELPRNRLIFWLYYRSGLSASAIASLPNIGLTTKGVESALLRLTRSIRAAFAHSTVARKETQKDSFEDQKGFTQPESF